MRAPAAPVLGAAIAGVILINLKFLFWQGHKAGCANGCAGGAMTADTGLA